MEREEKRQFESSKTPTEKSAPRLTAVKEVTLSLTERVIAFVDARMNIVEEKPAPRPMRKAG
jgi:hypothetical protein